MKRNASGALDEGEAVLGYHVREAKRSLHHGGDALKGGARVWAWRSPLTQPGGAFRRMPSDGDDSAIYWRAQPTQRPEHGRGEA